MKKIWFCTLFLFTLFFCFDIDDVKAISNGTYKIVSALDEDKVLDIKESKASNGSNIQLYSDMNLNSQHWVIKELETGVYSITALVDDGMSLDVFQASKLSGANIQLFNYKETDNQRWIIKYAGDGYYYIISKYSGKYMDVYQASSVNGTNIQIFDYRGGDNQKFKFEKVNEKVEESLENGVYTIKSSLNDNLVLDIKNKKIANGSNVYIFYNGGWDSQYWNVEKLDDSYYSITTINNNMSLDVFQASKLPGTNVQLFDYKNTDNQKWLIKDAGNGYYYIISKNSKKYLDIYKATASNKANVQIFDYRGGNNQKFKFEKVITENKKNIDDGIYTIKSTLNENFVLSPPTEIIGSGVNVQLSLNKSLDSQKWYIKYLNDGYYSIKPLLTDDVSLDVYGANDIIGTNVQLFSYKDTENQRWLIKDAGNGYYYIISSCNGLYLGIDKLFDIENSNVQMTNYNGENNQKFKFEKANNIIPAKTLEDGVYEIQSGLNNNMVLDVFKKSVNDGTNIQLFNSKSGNNQKWTVKYLNNGYYSITTALSDHMFLDVNMKNNVQLNSYTGEKNQQWIIKDAGDGYYYIVSRNNNLYLDIYQAQAINGANVQTFNYRGTNNQKFKFVKTKINYQKIENGYYTIHSAVSTNKVFEVAGAKMVAGTNVVFSLMDESLAQIWKIKYLEDGMYLITSALNPKRFLTNVNGHIVVDKYMNTDNQKWFIDILGNGNISIISAADKLYIMSDKNVNDVNISNSDESLFQKFHLNLYSNKKTYKGIDISKWQGNIDWKLLSEANPQFIIMRIGRGLADLGKDVKFETYYENATEYGIPIGVYIYGFANNLEEARKEANYVIEWLNGKDLDLPVFYDMEYSGQLYLGKVVLTEIAETFCGTISKNNYHCGVYANIYWLNNFLDGKHISNMYPIWLAHWTGADDYDTVLNNYDKYKTSYGLSPYKYWQFSSLGKYPGITENTVDLDFGYDIFD